MTQSSQQNHKHIYERYLPPGLLDVTKTAQMIVWNSESEQVMSRGLTSHSTLYRSFRGQFLDVRWPNQQRKRTEESQLATEIGFSPIRTIPPCYNMNCRQPPIG